MCIEDNKKIGVYYEYVNQRKRKGFNNRSDLW